MKLGLHSIKWTFLLFVLISIQPVFAAGASNFTVFGDLPHAGATFNIIAYNNTQSSPCDGNKDDANDVRFFFSDSVNTSDSNFNDNDDYNRSSDNTISGATTVFFYYCNATGVVATISKSVVPTIDLNLDLGRVAGGIPGSYPIIVHNPGRQTGQIDGMRNHQIAIQGCLPSVSRGQAIIHLGGGCLIGRPGDG